MTRIDTIRAELIRKLRSPRFQPFALNMENGDRIIVEHPENVAFNPNKEGRDRLIVLSDDLMHTTSLSAVTSVSELDRGEPSS
jgi:hypothetical protein